MRKRLMTGAAVLLLACPVFSQEAPEVPPVQENPFPKTFSLEVGTGIAPLHTLLLAPSWDIKRSIAEKGQEFAYPTYPISITAGGVWRVSRRTEYSAYANLSWSHAQVVQYDVFGTDPAGKPRYAAGEEGTSAGWMNVTFIPSVTFRYRHLWNPDEPVVVYSGLGVGWTLPTAYVPLPDLTLVGFRVQRRSFRIFLEFTMSPVASLAHGGLGWTF